MQIGGSRSAYLPQRVKTRRCVLLDAQHQLSSASPGARERGRRLTEQRSCPRGLDGDLRLSAQGALDLLALRVPPPAALLGGVVLEMSCVEGGVSLKNKNTNVLIRPFKFATNVLIFSRSICEEPETKIFFRCHELTGGNNNSKKKNLKIITCTLEILEH